MVLQPPLPLQSFLPLQPLLPVLQPPWPLQSFLPLQSCFAAGVAGVDDVLGVAGVAFLVSGADVDGVDGVLGVADDGSAGGFGASPPQATRTPPTAATSSECAIFIWQTFLL